MDEKYEILSIEGGNLNKTIIPDEISNNEPIYTLPVLFTIDDLKNISSSNNKFTFTLNGKLAEKNNNPKEIKNLELAMKEIDEKAKCDFKSDDQLKASFNCTLEPKDMTKIKDLTFKNNEVVMDGSQGVYIESLEQIHLINDDQVNPSNQTNSTNQTAPANQTNPIKFPYYKSKKNGLKTLGIVLGIIVGVIVLAIVGALIFCLQKANAKMMNETNNINITNQNGTYISDISNLNK